MVFKREAEGISGGGYEETSGTSARVLGGGENRRV